jgi:hypothetical protein
MHVLVGLQGGQHDEATTTSSHADAAITSGFTSIVPDGRGGTLGAAGDAGVSEASGPALEDAMLCAMHQKPVQLYSEKANAVLCLDCYFAPTAGSVTPWIVLLIAKSLPTCTHLQT